MTQHVYLLTLKSGDTVTRLQVGCIELTFGLLSYADACGTFHSFTRIPLSQLPQRDAAEMARVKSFMAHAYEFNAKAA